MDPFKQVIAKINTQLADLTASQRLAIGLCAVVIVGSLLWLLRWSAEPDYVRLLEEPMTADQIVLAQQSLPLGEYKIAGDHILVSPSARRGLLWSLQSAGALPADTSVTFARLIEDDSPFRPAAENQFRRRVALQNELAQVFVSSGLVKSADVFITDTSERRVNAPNVVPTASVTVTMAAGRAIGPETVRACAALVAGAVPGLTPHNVSVIDASTLREFKLPSPEDAMAAGQLDEKKRHEDHLVKKVADQLSYIPGVRVAVSVQLDTARTSTLENSYAEPAVSEETTNASEMQTGGPSGETGVGPNVGQSLPSGSQGGRDTSDETSTKFQNQQLAKRVTTEQLPFAVRRTTASIGVPHSYVSSVLSKIKGTEEPPTDDEVTARFAVERQRILAAVKNIVMAEFDDDITVSLFPDLEPAVTLLPDGSLASAASRAGGSEWTAVVSEYAPQGGLALLAVMGLIMLSRMAKRSARDAAELYGKRIAAATSADHDSEEPLTVDAGSVGRALPTEESMLEARELSDDMLRAAQLTEQVTKLIDDDPQAVSKMLRRWAEATE